MSSSNQNNGGQPPNGLVPQPKRASLGDIFAADQWLLNVGIPTEVTADTLLGYAYMQPGVVDASMEMNMDEIGNGDKPSLTYNITLDKKLGKRYVALRTALGSKGIFNKIKALWLLRKRTPAPGFYENMIGSLAKNYLPPKFKVVVNVK